MFQPCEICGHTSLILHYILEFSLHVLTCSCFYTFVSLSIDWLCVYYTIMCLFCPRIYKYQAHGYAFSSVEELLNSLGGSGFLNMTRRSLSESLLELGVSQRFIDDIVAPIMRVNYGQNVSMPAFVGRYIHCFSPKCESATSPALWGIWGKMGSILALARKHIVLKVMYSEGQDCTINFILIVFNIFGVLN